MPPRSPRPSFPGHLVTAVIVSHDGQRWLPECLAALAAQDRPPQRVVAVDTGSTDDSVRLLTDALGPSAVLTLPRDASLGRAIDTGLAAFDSAPAPTGVRGTPVEWVWVLHDDCAPEPGALRELLAAAADAPSVAAFGPKVLTWSGARLREVGLTVDAGGDPQTGLEPREVDQGQHDDVGDVLAVGTAGMLVRRSAWQEQHGLDETWPLLRDDVDFGWRLNAAGERVRVAPRAVVRHAAALQTGQRGAEAVDGRPGAAARRHGLQVVLANTSRWLVVPLLLRYVAEGLARALGLLLLRQPRAAADQLIGYATTFTRPGTVLAARRRRTGRTVAHAELRGLLAPPTVRLRRLGDAVARTFGGRDAAQQRQRRRAPVETGPVSAEAEELQLDDVGALLRLLRRPAVLLTIGLTAAGLVAGRDLLGGGLHGGRLLPPPDGSAHLWATYLSAWHPVQLGTTTPAPPFLAVLALLSTVLFGKVWLAVDLLMVGAAPLAGLTAYAAAGRATRSTPLRLTAAVTYAVLPALTGAVSGGRIDVVFAVVLLPLLGWALAAAMTTPAWNRWVAAGVVLALVMACAPYVWCVAGAALVVTLVVVPGHRLRRLAAAGVALAVPLLLLVPWTGSLFAHPTLFLRGSGLPEMVTAHQSLPPADVMLLRPGGPDQPPLWVLAPFVAAALVALARSRHSVAARLSGTVFAVGVAAAIVATRLSGPSPTEPDVHYWTGVPLAVAAMGALWGAVLAADGAREALRRHSFGWRQPAAALLAVAAAAGTATAGVAWIGRGSDGPLTDRPTALLPVFAAAEVARPTSPRALALRPRGSVVRYSLLRHPDGPRLGDADVAPRASGRDEATGALARAVQAAVAGQAAAVPMLADLGVSMLVVPNEEAAGLPDLGTVDGLVRVPTTSAVVWRVAVPTGELVVLPPAAATVAGRGDDAPVRPPRRPRAATAGRADVTLPSGPAGRLLVLAEPASAHWRATLGGRRLTPAEAYGWAQAWRLPTTGGRLHVSRAEHGRTGWLALELALVVVAVLLTIPSLRPDTDEVGT